jgi:hypothetical protein
MNNLHVAITKCRGSIRFVLVDFAVILSMAVCSPAIWPAAMSEERTLALEDI